MQVLTAFILAALCSYAGFWYFGFIEGNFALLMLMAVVISGIYWLAEKFYFWPQRLKAVAQLDTDQAKRQQELSKMGIERVDTDTGEARNQLLMQPWWLDWTAGLLPVILFIFISNSNILFNSYIFLKIRYSIIESNFFNNQINCIATKKGLTISYK